MRRYLKNLIREVIREELKAALAKQSEKLATILNAYGDRMARLEEALNQQTGAMNGVGEALYSVAEIAVGTRDYVRKDVDEANWWKGERG